MVIIIQLMPGLKIGATCNNHFKRRSKIRVSHALFPIQSPVCRQCCKHPFRSCHRHVWLNARAHLILAARTFAISFHIAHIYVIITVHICTTSNVNSKLIASRPFPSLRNARALSLSLSFSLKVCCALSQIAKHSVDLAEVVVGAEIFPKILTCLKFPDEFVKKHSATVVREVAKHTPELAQLVVGNGGVGALVDYISELTGTGFA